MKRGPKPAYWRKERNYYVALYVAELREHGFSYAAAVETVAERARLSVSSVRLIYDGCGGMSLPPPSDWGVDGGSDDPKGEMAEFLGKFLA